jgi:chromosomal replication initiator protein
MTTDTKAIWNSILVEVELNVSKGIFSTWFRDTHVVKIEDGVVYLGVPSVFAKEWLCGKFHNKLLQYLRDMEPSVRSMEYLIASPKEVMGQPEARPHETIKSEIGKSAPLPLSSDMLISKDDNLNPRYTFDSFVVGPFNELAHAASQAIIKKPVAYNPLYIYGHTGLGKTHLMQAIGNYIKHNHQQKKVYYITSEKFSQEFIDSVQNNKINSFKDKYRKYDVLIMDDVQFLSTKEKTQEELFHLFNHLYNNNKQIIFSSDVHPNYIQNLEDRLKSRFVSGMTVDVPAPDKESRVAILQNKIEKNGIFIEDEVIEFIASTVIGNIRELEGLLNLIVAQTELKLRGLTLQEIKNLVKTTTKPVRSLPVKDLVKIIADFYNIEEESIYNKTRRKEVVKPRQLIMYILREDFNISYPSIGQKLGGRDHTTVIHSCEKIKNELKINSSTADELAEIRAMI